MKRVNKIFNTISVIQCTFAAHIGQLAQLV
jgi:hypothetical protein